VLQSDCKKEEEGMTVIEFLKEEKINSSLIEGIMEFRASHPVREEDRGRIPVPRYLYYGRDVWEQAVAALLFGFSQGRRQRERTYWPRIWRQRLAGRFGTSPFTLTWMRPA